VPLNEQTKWRSNDCQWRTHRETRLIPWSQTLEKSSDFLLIIMDGEIK
jgi:hypothetical protein